MAHSSLDLMSSPDPLTDFPSSAVPSSRRITRSQRSSSFLSLSNESPRKQTFSLDVGNGVTPTKIRVTVEAEEPERDDISRRLFTSSAPRSVIRRHERTTTTTVPLRGVSDDEDGIFTGAGTPKKRGRPRRSGTPTPRPRKRAGTPMQKTPRQTRRKKVAGDESASELSVADSQATPKSTTRAKKTPKRKTAATPAKKADTINSTADSQPRKRGRPRKQPLPSEDLEAIVDETILETTIIVQDSPPAVPNDKAAAEEDAVPQDLEYAAGDEADEDIWMATLSDAPTPVPRSRAEAREIERPSESSLEIEHPFRSPSPPKAQATFLEDYQSDTETAGSVALIRIYDNSDTESHVSSHVGQNPQDLDTIAQGEDFSMISFDSMPALQANLSMEEAELPEMGEMTSLIVSKTLESLRQDQPAPADDDTTPRPNKSLDSSTFDQVENNGPLFSQPASSPQTWSRSPRRNKNTPLSRQVALKSLQLDNVPSFSPSATTAAESMVADKSPAVESPRRNAEEPSNYEDSFSEIPEAVLEAATPRRPRAAPTVLDVEEPEMVQPMFFPRSRSASATSISESNRLLTPEETPSPAEGDHSPEARTDKSKSTVRSVARSSPPEFNISVSARHSRKNSSETPLAQEGSPELPPVPTAADDLLRADNLAVSSPASRPALSPIVRAGRALQSVTSDPPSPKDRQSVLGSPFRSSQRAEDSPVPRSPAPAPTPVPQSERSWSKAFAPFSQLRDLVVQGAQVFSPRLSSAPAVQDQTSPTPSNNQAANLNLPSEDHDVFGTLSSTRAAPPSEDGMDWEADPAPSLALKAGQATGSFSSVFATKNSMTSKDLLAEAELESEPQSEGAVAEEEEEDEDIWAIEAQREEEAAPRQQKQKSKAPDVDNAPRRSKLPSPWRKNSRRLLYSDELANAVPSPQNEQSSQAAEFSLLSLPGGANAKVLQENVPPPRPGRVDLSAFFSSPAVVPEIQRPGQQTVEKPATAAAATAAASTQRNQPLPTVARPVAKAPEARISTQTSSFQPRARQPSISQKLFEPLLPQGKGESTNQRRIDLFSPSKPTAEVNPERATSPSTPERVSFAHVPQKRNFTPLLKKPATSLFDPSPAPPARPSSRGQTEVDIFSDEPAPPQQQQQQEQQKQQDSSILDSSFVSPVLKPLPDRQASPTKSCMRSPTKPKTPGRVVEFTSSTLSPLAQMQVRAERSGLASWGQDFSPSTSSKLPPPSQQQQPAVSRLDPEGADKENTAATNTTTMRLHPLAPPVLLTPHQLQRPASASPTSSPTRRAAATGPAAAASATLSQTTWSRAHWLRLDELLQRRRSGGPLHFQLRHPGAMAAQGKRGSQQQPRASSALLGKHIVAQGETMALERWHLDVVDAFCDEVGGWGESVVAKRVFALLVGEERRRLGLVPRRT